MYRDNIRRARFNLCTMQHRRTFLQLLSGIPLLVATGFTQRALAAQVGAAHRPAPFAPSNIDLCDVYIAGLQHTRAFDICLHELLSVGEELVFVREPENIYDKRAIAVYARQGFRIGYLPKWSNYIPAKLLDDGVKLRGSIAKINADEPPWHYVKVRVSIDVPNSNLHARANCHPNNTYLWSLN